MSDATLAYTLRWMIRRDYPGVLEIEASREFSPWTEKELNDELRRREVMGFVVESGDRIVGFMIFEIVRTSYRIIRLTVHPSHRRFGAGKLMAERIVYKLEHSKRKRIIALVRESNLSGQLFLKSSGFRAIKVHREHFEDTDEDAFEFVLRRSETNTESET